MILDNILSDKDFQELMIIANECDISENELIESVNDFYRSLYFNKDTTNEEKIKVLKNMIITSMKFIKAARI
jgi:phage tail sheath gpL-like